MATLGIVCEKRQRIFLESEFAGHVQALCLILAELHKLQASEYLWLREFSGRMDASLVAEVYSSTQTIGKVIAMFDGVLSGLNDLWFRYNNSSEEEEERASVVNCRYMFKDAVAAVCLMLIKNDRGTLTLRHHWLQFDHDVTPEKVLQAIEEFAEKVA